MTGTVYLWLTSGIMALIGSPMEQVVAWLRLEDGDPLDVSADWLATIENTFCKIRTIENKCK